MNLNIVGIGITVTFTIIALSAITLYLAFRIKETFRDEKSFKIQLVKTLFLVGMLFLAGGMFYFFGQAMSSGKQVNDTNFSKMIGNTTVSNDGLISLTAAYPAMVKTNDSYIVFFTVESLTTKALHNATIKVTGLPLFDAKSYFKINSDSLVLGDIYPGKTNGSIQLKAPSFPTILEGSLIFRSSDSDTIIQPIRIEIADVTTVSDTTKQNKSILPPVYNIFTNPFTNPPAPTNPNPAPTQTPNASNASHTNSTSGISGSDSTTGASITTPGSNVNQSALNSTINGTIPISNTGNNTNATNNSTGIANNGTNNTGNNTNNTVNNSNNTANNNTNSTSGTPNVTVTGTPNFTYVPTPKGTSENMNIT